MRSVRALLWTVLLLSAAGAQAAAEGAVASAGERIYLEGVLPSGAPLVGVREDNAALEGPAVACVNCHRRSGLGTIEGTSLVPPITVKYLRRSAETNIADLEMAHVEGFRQTRTAYTDASLAMVLRTGLTPEGRKLSVLMPRYPLDEPAMRELIQYLDGLGVAASPGVSDTTLQFATIITPDADPVERAAMLAVMQRFFANQAEVIAAETRPLKSTHEIRYRVTRRWELHVWELMGSADGWEQQLRDRMTVEPVFAVVSGLGRSTWEPVHRFCESMHVPCLFPNVDAPTVDDRDFYSVYFSRGVLLEADLMAGWLARPEAPARPTRLIQVFRRNDVGAAAAAALRVSARAQGIETVEPALPAVPRAGDLAAALRQVKPGDSLVLWLRAADLAALPPKPPARSVLVSGLMADLESAALPSAWRSVVRLTYPVDLPERRQARMNFPYGWFKVQHIPLTSERVQVDTYLACVIASETVGHLFDSFVPEFLLERMEMMVGRRLANAYYPRLGLAQGQRFASKGGFMVHFDDSSAPAALPATADARASHGIRVIADTDWMTP